MKKFLPLIIFVVGVVVLLVVFLATRSGGSVVEDEEAYLREIPLAQRPFTTLTAKEDGHYLNLSIDAVKVIDAVKLDYELIYKLPDGRQQGVPGTVDVTSAKIERPLLLGSESSGKFRYDEGVTEGSLTLRFRNDKGKLIGKLTTDFHLEKSPSETTSLDGKIKYKFNKTPKDIFFVTMQTFGLPKALDNVTEGPYVITASKQGPYPGTISFTSNIKRFDGVDYREVPNNESPDVGVFVGIK